MILCWLSDRPDLHAQTAALMTTCWPDHYGPDGAGDALGDVKARSGTDDLPLGCIAVSPDGCVIGTAALTAQSYGAQGQEGPWIGGLCTAPDARNQGVATQMVQAVTAQAAAQGFRQLFTTTRQNGGVFRKLGWQPLRMVADTDWQVWIYQP